MAVSANRLELLQIADAVAREKSIDRRIVITAMEDAIAKAARSRYGSETEVHAEIDAKTGELRLARHMLVVELVENPSNQISLEDARKRHPAAQLGDTTPPAPPPRARRRRRRRRRPAAGPGGPGGWADRGGGGRRGTASTMNTRIASA